MAKPKFINKKIIIEIKPFIYKKFQILENYVIITNQNKLKKIKYIRKENKNELC